MTLKLLHIDDEDNIREVVVFALALDPDIEIRSESSGTTGLATAASWRPDAILLDVMMPLVDGPTTLRRLKSNYATKKIPVIFFTVKDLPNEISELIDLGARGVIKKPFNPMALASEDRMRIAA